MKYVFLLYLLSYGFTSFFGDNLLTLCKPLKFAALSATLVWLNFQTYSLVVLLSAENSSYSLASWFIVSNFIIVLWMQTKNVFPIGFYTVIRYCKIWLLVLFYFEKIVQFLKSSLNQTVFFLFSFFRPQKCCTAVLLLICANFGREPTTKEIEGISKCCIMMRTPIGLIRY